MLGIFNIINKEYIEKSPFPFYYQDSFLLDDIAHELQTEILNLPDSEWDRYDNPFEQKYTLRDKYKFPRVANKLFEELQSDIFINHLSEICGYKLIIDPTRNFWGIHKYKNGDRLDIHVDAGLHPISKHKKQLTFGLYLSYNWKEEYGCSLEIWKGTNANRDPRLLEKAFSISPIFNRAVIFTNNDYSWHGNPIPVSGENDSKRVFITISYLSNNLSDENKRVKALFIKHPDEKEDIEKDRLRLLRADPEQYKYIYRV
jgi:hypothetical protein